MILGDDFTVRGGASDASIAGKMLMAEQMANEYGMPIVRMIDGTGGGGSVKSLETEPAHLHPDDAGMGMAGGEHAARAGGVAGAGAVRRTWRGACARRAISR